MGEETQRKYGVFSSSINPQEFSLTLQSGLKIVAYLVTSFLAIKGIHVAIDDAGVTQLADSFTVIATSALTIWQAGNVAYGIVRKFFNRG